MLVTHYTNDNPFILRPIVIKNDWHKPKGGLWTSPINSTWGWKEWCAAEEFGIKKYPILLDIDMANSITLNKVEHLSLLYYFIPDYARDADADPSYWTYINYERIKKEGHTSIHLTLQGLRSYKSSYGDPRFYNFWGWDCESVLILDERCVKSYEATSSMLNRVY